MGLMENYAAAIHEYFVCVGVGVRVDVLDLCACV